MRNKTRTLFVLMASALLTSQVSAVRMGLIVVFPDGIIYQKCLDAQNGASGYDILEQSGLNITWSPSVRYGHQLCAINSLGCSKDNCNCNRNSAYWNVYLKRVGYSEWEYPDSIESRFDAGTTCQEHYCAKEGDIIGLKYSTYQDTPFSYRLGDVCTEDTGKDIHIKKNTVSPQVAGQVVFFNTQRTFSLTILGGFFIVAVLLGTVRYVRKRR
jgi:hypothetical protein